MRALLLVVVATAAACGPVDKSVRRPLVTDETPLGTSRADVKRWHLDHDWCERRTWDQTDHFTPCNDPVVVPSDREGGISSYFRFDGDRLVASVVYSPVPCNTRSCSRPIGIDTELEGPPFLSITEGLTVTPVAAGRDGAPDVELPQAVHRSIGAMRVELEARLGPPRWKNRHETAVVWTTATGTVGLFVSADSRWIVEAHQAAAVVP